MRSTIAFPSPGGKAGDPVETARRNVVKSMRKTSYHTLIVGFFLVNVSNGRKPIKISRFHKCVPFEAPAF